VVEEVIVMPATEERVSITLTLPREVLDQVDCLAKQSKESVEKEFESLIESGLKSRLSAQERFDRLSDMYRARLAREGKLNQTSEEIMAELQEIREKVANEFYPK
jgi:hypothetical protein